MKKLPMPDISEDDAADRFYNSGKVGVADSNQTMDALETLDRILIGNHGLEIGLYDSGGSDYLFTIVPRGQAARVKEPDWLVATRDDLNKLAERAEQASGPDRRLDDDVHDALDLEDAMAPAYTQSLDCAMRLVKNTEASAIVRDAVSALARRFSLHTCFWPENEPYGEWLARFIVAAVLRATALERETW